jgi:hypothetical protein
MKSLIPFTILLFAVHDSSPTARNHKDLIFSMPPSTMDDAQPQAKAVAIVATGLPPLADGGVRPLAGAKRG